MANHKSAIKRMRQNAKRRDRNRIVRSRVRTHIKRVDEAVKKNEPQEAATALGEASRLIRKAGSKGVYHHKTVDRKISRLTKLVNKLEQAG